MGGHGGLNILPQKRWNVYNYENREKVRQDEEAAAKEEQLKREQSRRRDSEFRLERLRSARNLDPVIRSAEPDELEPKTGHINLFEGIKIFDPIKGLENEGGDEGDGFKKKQKRMKREEAAPKVVGPEDEKYRLGYGLAGKGVKLPWYLEKRSSNENGESGRDNGSARGVEEEGKKSGKKTLEELRKERLKREKREKERERALVLEKNRRDGAGSKDRGFSRRQSGDELGYPRKEMVEKQGIRITKYSSYSSRTPFVDWFEAVSPAIGRCICLPFPRG